VTFTLHARVALTNYTKSATVTIAGDTSPTYVALGDSFSSGEGNPQGGWVDSAGQSNGSDGANDGCDRAVSSYPKLTASWLRTQPGFQGTSFAFYACSGDTTSDITPSSGAQAAGLMGANNGGKEPFQLMNSSALSRARIVTLTAGGDDLNFADVLNNCIMSTLHDCNTSSNDGWINRLSYNIDKLEPVLEATYRRVKAAAPRAAIYVVGYPRIFASNPTNGCAGLSLSAIKYLVPLQVKLNEKIKLAATNTFVNYVEPNAGGRSFVGHDVCSSSPWFNRVNLGHQKYSFHPNGPGQTALANAVQTAIIATHAMNPLGVQGLDNYGQAIDAQSIAIAERVLIAARSGNISSVEAICRPRCQDGTDVALRTPGALAQLVTILTKTHPSTTDGHDWPGFVFDGGMWCIYCATDLRIFHISTVDQYHGLEIWVVHPPFLNAAPYFQGVSTWPQQ